MLFVKQNREQAANISAHQFRNAGAFTRPRVNQSVVASLAQPLRPENRSEKPLGPEFR